MGNKHMADFEYLQNIPFGQYIATGSPVRKLDARARILGFTFLLMAVTFSTHLIGLVIALGFILIVLAVLRLPFRFILRSLLAPLPFLLVLAILQLLFYRTAAEMSVLFSIGSLKITVQAFWSAVMLLIRFMDMILIIHAASASISTSEGIQATSSLLSPLTRLGFPSHILVMVVQVTVHYFPLLAITAENIAKAQASRGAAIGRGRGNVFQRARQIIPLIMPLFTSSLKKAENLALAMEARAYGVFKERTSMVEFKFRWYDWIALIIALGLGIAIVLV
jgi:energy-coupling factor transport system permease protein